MSQDLQARQEALNTARARYYEFLSFPLFWGQSEEDFEAFLAQARFLATAPITPENERDFKKIYNFEWAKFQKEQNAVLFDLSFVNVPQTASFFDEGRDDGKKRVEVINILKKAHLAIDAQLSEDYIGLIFALASRLLGEQKAQLAGELFGVINGFADEFCEILREHDNSKFFTAYANILASFVTLEREFLSLAAPQKPEVSQAKIALAKKPYETKVKSSVRRTKIFEEEFTKL